MKSLLLAATVLWLQTTLAPAVVLNVPQLYQEQTEWCWAGTSQMLLRYYETYVTQSEIAQYGTEGQNIWNWTYGSSSNPTRQGVDLILSHFDNIASAGYPQALSLATVRDEVDTNGRPFVIRWAWQTGNAHILVGHGIVNSNVYLHDPISGASIHSYDWVCSNSASIWTHSLKLSTAPPVITVSPTNLDFGLVEVGVKVTVTGFSIATNGRRSTVTGTVTAPAPPFYLGCIGFDCHSFSLPSFLPWVSVSYWPTNTGSDTQNVTFNVSGGTPVWRRVSGQAYTPAIGLAEALDATNLAWEISAPAYWQGENTVTHDGLNAAQSGAIADSQGTQMSTSLTGPGILSFWWKVSSQTNHDFLRFSTGTGVVETVSGEMDWAPVALVVPPGRQYFWWYYSKDSSGSAGQDAGWVDQVSFRPLQMVVPWGDNSAGQTNVPTDLTNVAAMAAGRSHNLALAQDGTVTAWGANDYGQTNVPPGLKSVLAIAAGSSHSLALTEDGTIVGWGRGDSGQTNAPPGVADAVALAAGQSHSLALRAGGRVFAWGDNTYEQTNVPTGARKVVAIAAGQYHSLALGADGQVIAWGNNASGQTNVPSGLTNATAIAGGDFHSMALKSNGTVVVWGGGLFSSWLTNVPAGLTNVVAIAAGGIHCLALKADRTVVAWGLNGSGQTNVPTGLTNVIAIAGGGLHSLALVRGDFPDFTLRLLNPVCVNNTFSASVSSYAGRSYCLEYKNSLQDANWTALPWVQGSGQGVRRTLSDRALNPAQRFYRARQQ